jgi:outer membrane murein-binding lipoprotein Lpp
MYSIQAGLKSPSGSSAPASPTPVMTVADLPPSPSRKKGGDKAEPIPITPSASSMDIEKASHAEAIKHLLEQVTSGNEKLTETKSELKTYKANNSEMEKMITDMNVQLSAAQDEANRMKKKLQEVNDSELMSRISIISDENSNLRHEIMRLRGETTRLTTQLQDVQQSAIEAVKMLNTLSPDSSVMEMLNKAMSGSCSGSNSLRSSPVKSQPGSPDPQSSQLSNSYGLSSTASVPASPTPGHALSRSALAPTMPSPMVAARGSWDLLRDLSFVDHSVSVPLIQLRCIRLIYDKYKNEDETMMHSRFIRFCKEFLFSPTASGATIRGCAPEHLPMLVAGEIDLIFKTSIKMDPDDKKQPFGTGNSKFVRRSQTSSASNMSYHQFIFAVSILARKLFVPVIEERFGTALEFLPLAQKEPAAIMLIEVIMKEKLIPGMARLQIIPWALLFLERTAVTIERGTELASILPQSVPRLMEWFVGYVDELPHGGAAHAPPTNMSLKSLLRFGHDFGIVPILIKETQMFELFEEAIVWRQSQGSRLLSFLPSDVLDDEISKAEVSTLRAPSSTFNFTPSKKSMALKSPVPGFPESYTPPTAINMKLQTHNESVGLPLFAFIMSAAAHQGFPDLPETERLTALLKWTEESGGDVILSHYK